VKLIIIVLITFFVLVVPITGQSVYTPEKGSTERKAILDALRIPVERQLKQQIVFVADNFSVQGTWAFVSGTPQSPSGGSPDYSGTVFQQFLCVASKVNRQMAGGKICDWLYRCLLCRLVEKV